MRDYDIIVAVAENRVIGRGGRLPWSIPEDWRHFLDTTAGGTLIVGRVCYEELLATGCAGPERRLVVVTRQPELPAAGAHVERAGSATEALAVASRHHRPIWIGGGERLYTELLPKARRLYLTLVHATPAGDTFFPEWRRRFTKVISSRRSQHGEWRYTFLVLEPSDEAVEWSPEWRLLHPPAPVLG